MSSISVSANTLLPQVVSKQKGFGPFHMPYLILLSLLLTGCAAPALIAGAGVASVGVNEATGKTITDHTLSTMENKDCRIARALKNKQVCQTEIRTSTTPTIFKPEESNEVAKIEEVFARRSKRN